MELKNTELMEEKAKNAELRKHIELLKKRVYSKTEFEQHAKTAKAEATDLAEKLKVSEKIRKQQKTLIKELQGQIKRGRTSQTIESKKITKTSEMRMTKPDAKVTKPGTRQVIKRRLKADNKENQSANIPKENTIESRDSKAVMMPKYTTFGETQPSGREITKIEVRTKPKRKNKVKKTNVYK